MSRRLVRVALFLLLVLALSCKKQETAPAPEAAAPAPAAQPAAATTVSLPPNSWQVPVDVNPAPPPAIPQANYLNFGWQTFVALSWPALSPKSGGQRAQPNTAAPIGQREANGALIPAVWDTYRDIDTVFLDKGVDPGATYNQPTKIPSQCAALTPSNPVAPGFQPLFINGSTFTTATMLKDYINQATENPLVDQKGWYTITNMTINPAEYAFIQQNGYYLGANQVAAYVKNGQLNPFPKTGQEIQPPLPSWAQYGTLEIKATWRILNPATDAAIIPRYYAQWGYFLQPDGKTCQGPALFGLIGLHILRLTPSTGATWFWASFEQVDNVVSPSPSIPATLAKAGTPNGKCTTPPYNVGPAKSVGNIPWNGNNKPNDICEETPIPPAVQSVNQTWQKNLSGTVWQYYQMVNTQNPCPSDQSTCYDFPPINDPKNLINVNYFANTAIESYFQQSNCATCHGGAAGNGVPTPLTGTNQIFTFVLLNAYYPQTTQSLALRNSILSLQKKLPKSKALSAVHP